MKIIENRNFDEERALYGSKDLMVRNCNFDGPADGESSFKEGQNIAISHCLFHLRYPFWHVNTLKIEDSEMDERCRAALWYSTDIDITDTKLHGIKALRECTNVSIRNSDIASSEFGWSIRGMHMENSTAISEYFMMRSENITFSNVDFTGKYSFQYIKNAIFDHCRFDTKDAFWHGEHIVVKNSVVKGEYLAWYSNDLTLINCKIIGTQPFCYCDNLRLIDCEMMETDLAFEKSNVEATITTNVQSIKNPHSGNIYAPYVETIIMDDVHAKAKIHAETKKLVTTS